MKIKVLSVIFSAILVLSLTGCGKDGVDSSASDTGSSTTEVADNATCHMKKNILRLCTSSHMEFQVPSIIRKYVSEAIISFSKMKDALFPKQKKNALTIFQMSIRTYTWL